MSKSLINSCSSAFYWVINWGNLSWVRAIKINTLWELQIDTHFVTHGPTMEIHLCVDFFFARSLTLINDQHVNIFLVLLKRRWSSSNKMSQLASNKMSFMVDFNDTKSGTGRSVIYSREDHLSGRFVDGVDRVSNIMIRNIQKIPINAGKRDWKHSLNRFLMSWDVLFFSRRGKMERWKMWMTQYDLINHRGS